MCLGARSKYSPQTPSYGLTGILMTMMWSSRRFHVPSCLRLYTKTTSVIFGCQITRILKSVLMGTITLSIWRP